METPPHNNGGRRTRSALSEIPSRLLTLSVSEYQDRFNIFNNMRNIQNGFNNLSNGNTTPRGVSNHLLTPSPSPEELVIQQRGRKKIPVTFSPDIDELKKEMHTRDRRDQTPVKQPGSPGRSSIILRSTPRKRLLLTDPSEIIALSPNPKKHKVNVPLDTSEISLSEALKIYSSDQLITFISHIVQNHSYIGDELKKILGEPDLHAIEDTLNYLKRNIYKCLPRCRLVSKTDAAAYNRASTHILAFKKSVVEYGQRFLDSKQWFWIMEYVILSWKIIRSTPVWDNPSHNIPRKQCFRTLGTYCMSALRNGKFTADQLQHYETIITGFLTDNEDMQQCLSQIEKCLNS